MLREKVRLKELEPTPNSLFSSKPKKPTRKNMQFIQAITNAYKSPVLLRGDAKQPPPPNHLKICKINALLPWPETLKSATSQRKQ